jgi:hypothetical protein
MIGVGPDPVPGAGVAPPGGAGLDMVEGYSSDEDDDNNE